ncbi:hypothetical protein FHS61_001343 [Altererythrobacter atlanticus]|uniref:Uncharacterized protein n=1 Tax=Croceibacterium atlanticum TaxID=1267766 RepID=A0A0F7KXT4_9SPHN|nr:hypothetical protein [Croceibacterium atlanticum]AKH44027.1 hypothetical protein WYH_03007 [Croceibacterium atlanticum]MBB5732334.1 hypothetical protein [Croceibacterium atlanticum]
MRKLGLMLSMLFALTPAAASAHRLIEANAAVTVARSDVTVTPTIEWNRISQRPGNRAERWTLDGELLNDVLFFAEVGDGDTLFREVNRREMPLPQFSGNMLLVDVPSFLESSLRISKGVATFEVTSAAPVQFLSHDGIRFEFTTLGADDLQRRGVAQATIIDGNLFMMLYEAPALHFFQRNLADFEQLVASARID